jgi:hypothetical protein
MHDSDVRAAVLQMLDKRYSDDAHTRVVEEMGVWSGSARIDIAVINGELCGWELKSDSDTLQRLPQQAELYGRVFDRLTLVVGSKHCTKATALLPDWWNVLVAFEKRGCLGLEPVQLGGMNPGREPYFVAQLLWRDEAIAALETFGLARGWRSKTAKLIHERLAVAVPLPELSAYVRAALKRRPGWLGPAVGNERKMPASRVGGPLRSSSGLNGATGNLVDSIIAPTTS